MKIISTVLIILLPILLTAQTYTVKQDGTGDESYTAQTVIDGSFQGRCLYVDSCNFAEINGFTLQHGKQYGDPGKRHQTNKGLQFVRAVGYAKQNSRVIGNKIKYRKV